jgi:hypothetical protein
MRNVGQGDFEVAAIAVETAVIERSERRVTAGEYRTAAYVVCGRVPYLIRQIWGWTWRFGAFPPITRSENRPYACLVRGTRHNRLRGHSTPDGTKRLFGTRLPTMELGIP